MNRTVRWGIVGPGAVARCFADSMMSVRQASLSAIASTSETRRAAFGDRYQIAGECRYATYQALFDSDQVDAVYIATPHPFHAPLTLAALRAGKHVLCEKPAGVTAAEIVLLAEVAEQQGLLLLEGYMYRCHPQWARVVALVSQGAIGQVVHIRATMGFRHVATSESRLLDPALEGGAILDLGGYPVSLAQLIASAVGSGNAAEPETVGGSVRVGATGVELEAGALLGFRDGLLAECHVAIDRPLDYRAEITGTDGKIVLTNPWTPGRNSAPSDTTLLIQRGDEIRSEVIAAPLQLFAYEIELATRCILSGQHAVTPPAMTLADSIGSARVLDRWREAAGVVRRQDVPAFSRRLSGLLPNAHPMIPQQRIEGVALPVSKLIIGCDNQRTLADGAIVWDAWVEAGGNAFDTAYVYGGGLFERVLGQWIQSRGVGKQIVVMVKGAHTPWCTPAAIAIQLEQSLERLGLSFAPIYMMHRDNVEVPVGEFIDALNQLHRAGLIGVFGVSNWSVERFAAANDYAERHGYQPLQILNNNLSLAVMERPVWSGCVTANTRETLRFLTQTQTVHFSWSSQARGFFLPEPMRYRLPADTAPETCFLSDANLERRRRAELLATERGVSAHNVAMAWVLAQPFPSYALVGPRTSGELVTSLPALTLSLSDTEVAWLNLLQDSR